MKDRTQRPGDAATPGVGAANQTDALPLADRVPPQLYIVASGLIQYVGAGLAVLAFASVEPASVAWWRVLTGALVLLAWKRPWRGGLSASDLAVSALFGVIILTMNSSFYESIARLPLGTAVSLEFIGPVAVAVLRGRGWRPRVAAVLAFAGVACIGGLALDLTVPSVRTGVAWILLAALAWSAYIVVGQRASTTRDGIANLALGCAWGALLFAPLLGPGAMAATASWKLIATVVGVGLLSTAIPYSFEALAMRRLAAPTFALFVAILPATSALVGAVMLRQFPSVFELIGLVLVSAAVWLASREQGPSGGRLRVGQRHPNR